MNRLFPAFVLSAGIAVGSSVALAQQPAAQNKPSTPQTDPGSPGLWNTDAMIELAVQQLKMRYNLNAEQEKYTRLLMKKRVHEYLSVHETELRALLADAYELQRNPNSAEAKHMQDWSERALPLFNDARKAILDGNEEWGKVLDETQTKIHQADLNQMHENFAQMDEKFTRWSKGGFKVADLYPQPARPPLPTERVGGKTGKGLIPSASSNPEDFWEIYVNSMVTTYHFTKDQETAARAILQDCRNKAAQYRATNKAKLDDLTTRVNSVRAVPKKLDEFRKLEAQLTELLKPIQMDGFEELKRRVMGLATADQKAAVDKIAAAQQERLRESTRVWQERRAKMMAASSQASSSQPAGSQPVTSTAAAIHGKPGGK